MFRVHLGEVDLERVLFTGHMESARLMASVSFLTCKADEGRERLALGAGSDEDRGSADLEGKEGGDVDSPRSRGSALPLSGGLEAP